MATVLWFNGIPCICPHLNTANFEDHVKDEALFEQGYLLILDRCDVLVLCTDNYDDSAGTKLEIRRALERGIQVVTQKIFNEWLGVRIAEKEMNFPPIRREAKQNP